MLRSGRSHDWWIVGLTVLVVLVLVCGAVPRSRAGADSSAAATRAGLEPNIVGGEPVLAADFPYYVFLTDRFNSWQCGGTLVRPQWVLTAAHCVDGLDDDEVVAYLGYGETVQTQRIVSARIEVHPRYDIEYDGGQLSSLTNDVALVRLSTRADTDKARIGVAGMGRAGHIPRVGSKQTIIGWGRIAANGDLPSHLQQATVTVKRCNGSLLDEDQKGYVCASGDTTTGCFGDSGGPLLRSTRVVGVFSYVSLDCSPAPKYAVYTRVSSVIDWIDRTIALRCKGRVPTVRLTRGEEPTAGPDVIVGTAQADVINGLDGDDVICGFGGDDTIDGGGGNDHIRGGRGDDDLAGDSGDDLLIGGRGDDRIDGGVGTDRCRGGLGNNELVACENS